MTSYTDQKTRNLRTYSNDCERAERSSRTLSPIPVLSLLVNSIFVGAIPPVPPPPPGYASEAHATEIICSRAKRAAKMENGCINLFFKVRINKFSLYIVFFSFPLFSFFFFWGGGQKRVLPPPPHFLDWGGGGAPAPLPPPPPYAHFRRLFRPI